MTEADSGVVAQGYDAVYAALPHGVTLRRIWREHVLGEEYPAGFEHISFTDLPELRRLASELRLEPGGHLADFACGAGGPGLWVSRETGARLTGIDISSVGVAQAAGRASALGLAEQARFATGSFAESGLEGESMDAAMSIDAFQYAPDKAAAFREIARVLRRGGRFVFMAFELETARAKDLPVLGTDPVSDYAPALAAAGFEVELYEESDRWLERVTQTYQAIMDAQAAMTEELGEPAAAALLGEVSLTLQRKPYRRRVFVAATKW